MGLLRGPLFLATAISHVSNLDLDRMETQTNRECTGVALAATSTTKTTGPVSRDKRSMQRGTKFLSMFVNSLMIWICVISACVSSTHMMLLHKPRRFLRRCTSPLHATS